MFCSSCGKNILKEAIACPNCGCGNNSYEQSWKKESMIGLYVLSVFLPIGGLVAGVIGVSTRQNRLNGIRLLILSTICWLFSTIIILSLMSAPFVK